MQTFHYRTSPALNSNHPPKYVPSQADRTKAGTTHRVCGQALHLAKVCLILLVAVLPLVGQTPFAAAQSAGGACEGERFSDVCPGDWYYRDVLSLAARNAIGGYADGTFHPGNQITREQLIKVIVVAGGLSAPVPAAATYADVPPTQPGFSWIEIASANGVAGGYACGGAGEPCDAQRHSYFRPTRTTNRGQMTKVISNAFGLTSQAGTGAAFADVPETNPYYPYVGTIYNLNIAGGYTCGAAEEPCTNGTGQLYFRPYATTTRAQASKMINLGRMAAPHKTPTRIAATPTLPTGTTSPTGTPITTATPTQTQQATIPTSTSSLTPVPTRTSTVAPSPTLSPAASPTASPTSSPTPNGHLYGLLGQGGLGELIDTTLLQQQYDAGVRLRLLQLGWDVLQPDGSSSWSTGTASAFQQRIDAFIADKPDVHIVLDLGVQYPPAWAAQVDPLVDQYGTVWQAQFPNGGVNVYWSSTVRQYVANYIRLIFTNLDFHGRLWTVRVGPYQGELLYPHGVNEGRNLSFWAFDSKAASQNPVPGWLPGRPSPNGEAQRFYYWYVDNLVATFNFFQTEVRRYFAGYVAPVTPGLGMWDGTANQLISRNLNDSSLGYYGTGNYWQRIFSHLPPASAGVLNWCSSLGDGSGNDSSTNWWEWSSGKMMAYLAHSNGRDIYGENPGHNAYSTSGGADPRTTMQTDFETVQSSGYLGLMWVSQADMSDPACASLAQYGSMISQLP